MEKGQVRNILETGNFPASMLFFYFKILSLFLKAKTEWTNGIGSLFLMIEFLKKIQK